MEAVPPPGHGMIDVDQLEGGALGIGNVEDHGVEASKAVVDLEFEGVGFEE